jgi:hypothetical protein
MVFVFDENVASAVEIAALIMLVIGVFPYRIRTKNRNLIMHGFLSIVAMALNLVAVFYAMIPVFGGFVSGFGFSLLQSTLVWTHAVSGFLALVLGFVIIFSWVTHPLGELGCTRMWRVMMPTFAVWGVTIVLGLMIHFLGII